MIVTTTKQTRILSLAGAIVCLVLIGCSDDSSNGDEPGDSSRDAAIADISTDTVASDVADLSSDARETDTSDTSHTGDTTDISDITERDGDTSDVGKIPTGEDCPCTGGNLAAVACDACEDGVCFTQVDANPRNYCSRHCSDDADCEDLGSQWRCDVVCVKEES